MSIQMLTNFITTYSWSVVFMIHGDNVIHIVCQLNGCLGQVQVSLQDAIDQASITMLNNVKYLTLFNNVKCVI